MDGFVRGLKRLARGGFDFLLFPAALAFALAVGLFALTAGMLRRLVEAYDWCFRPDLTRRHQQCSRRRSVLLHSHLLPPGGQVAAHHGPPFQTPDPPSSAHRSAARP